MKSSGLKVIALDFDGTLIESNNIKDRAFETILSDWPEFKETMMQWHLTHDSIERREKFRYLVEELLNLQGQSDLIEKLTLRFGKLTRTAIIKCPFVNGAEAFLKYIRKRVAVYLVSASPQLDLDQIIEERKLGKYFKKVYGAPIQKVETLKKIMFLEKVEVDEILFIGDSPEDQQAAKVLGINFIGRQSDRHLDSVYENIFTNFLEIKEYIKRIYAI